MLIDRTLHVLYHEVEFQKSELAIINAWSLRSVVNYYNESIEKNMSDYRGPRCRFADRLNVVVVGVSVHLMSVSSRDV